MASACFLTALSSPACPMSPLLHHCLKFAQFPASVLYSCQFGPKCILLRQLQLSYCKSLSSHTASLWSSARNREESRWPRGRGLNHRLGIIAVGNCGTDENQQSTGKYLVQAWLWCREVVVDLKSRKVKVRPARRLSKVSRGVGRSRCWQLSQNFPSAPFPFSREVWPINADFCISPEHTWYNQTCPIDIMIQMASMSNFKVEHGCRVFSEESPPSYFLHTYAF